ncbi:hypothetical protein HPG69_012642 [Diceros bicornis minor]|uniref:Proline dehydrogenase n=1 Tax=Diceros bicornis minor TaxID=77932 RepID=A0A7J7EY12_DICBM|nr:hypothetical protein HPG69_012642 [Diceros bicornis minor]
MDKAMWLGGEAAAALVLTHLLPQHPGPAGLEQPDRQQDRALQAPRGPEHADGTAGASAVTVHRGGGAADDEDAAEDGHSGQGRGPWGVPGVEHLFHLSPRQILSPPLRSQKAAEAGVRLMVDAEQTYFQPAISRLTLEMQRRFNVEKPLIFGTYQCYLKDAYDNVTLDVQLARREGWCFGAKLVRGAYMAQERARAVEIGYEDPINPTYEATSAMYHRCLDYVLEELMHNAKAEVMVASHNEDTVRFTLRRMEELGLHPADRQVSFGQLLGMCDQISFPLGQAGFPVYKYVPYGPVMEVLPYLSRRALENSGILMGGQRQRQLLWQELMRRLRTGGLFHRPA